jgi:GNAT superfamily N-acetyltransferase
VNLELALSFLKRDPLRHIVALKMLHALGETAETHFASSEHGESVLVLLDANAFSYDREHYGDAHHIAVISSDHALLTRQLLKFVPRSKRIVFKLSSDADALEVQKRFAVQLVTAFLSFTDVQAHAADPNVTLGLEPSDEMWAWFTAQGHERDWLEPMLREGRAFCVTLGGNSPESVCFAFENFGAIWEVGGVFTPPELRGRGLARRVVTRAVAELQRRGLKTRYQVQEDNLASVGVARGIGLSLFLTITHFQTL